MDGKITALPNGLDTVISKELDNNGTEFSGGEYQKLSLARSILVNHALMLFDEPSSSLEPNAEKAFFENIKQLCHDCTAIVISHRLSISKFADKIWVLHDGEVVEQGSHAELMNLNGRYAAMFINQAENYIEADA